jgi:salicylate hydroxylase
MTTTHGSPAAITAGDVDIAIVGGGIGGLANAYALAGTGHTVRVLERAPEFTEVGAGLQLAPNATRILRQWGLLDEVLAAGVTPRRLVFRDALDGSELTRLDFDDHFVRHYGAPYVVIHRGDLLDILVRACENAGVELVPDCAVEDVDARADGATVRACQGEHHAQVVVAADGLRSALRAKLSDDQPVCSGYVAYRGAFPTGRLTHLGADSLDTVVVYIGPGCHLVQYPLRGGEIFNTVAVFASPSYRRGNPDWGGPDELDEVFAPACEQVRAGLAALWRERRWAMYDRPPIGTWVTGRLVLSGDAAHPMLQYLAQGACQAIEDASCLAGHVRSSAGAGGTDWSTALRRYEAERTARTGLIQTTARTWGEIWHVSGIARTLRNELFRRRDPADYTYLDWLYAPSGGQWQPFDPAAGGRPAPPR